MDKEVANKTPKGRISWRKSISVNNITKTLEVEELDNGGFLVKYNKYGEVDGEYKDICKKFYSETNPLAKEDPIKEEGNAELDMILSIISNEERIL